MSLVLAASVAALLAAMTAALSWFFFERSAVGVSPDGLVEAFLVHDGGYRSMEVGLYDDRVELATSSVRVLPYRSLMAWDTSGQEVFLYLNDGDVVRVFFPNDAVIPVFTSLLTALRKKERSLRLGR